MSHEPSGPMGADPHDPADSPRSVAPAASDPAAAAGYGGHADPTGADRAGARLRRQRWRARRGLLENDIVLERFFEAHGDGLSDDQIRGLDILLDLTDPELLDLILGRIEPQGEAASPAARAVLAGLRAC